MITRERLPLWLAIAALVISVISSVVMVVSIEGDDEASVPIPESEVYGQDFERGYAQAARYGDLVWTAGHLPEAVSPTDSVAQQTEAVLDSLEATLEEAGAGFDTALITNVYLTNFDDWEKFNAVYRQRMADRVPPRVTVEIGELGLGYDIEISMVAHVRD